MRKKHLFITTILILTMSLSKGICQQNTNHCFDSIELKKISYIIFERDYLKSLVVEQEHENKVLNSEIRNFSVVDSLRVKNLQSKDSIVEEKEKIILSEINKNKELSEKVKRRNLAITIISAVSIILLIIK